MLKEECKWVKKCFGIKKELKKRWLLYLNTGTNHMTMMQGKRPAMLILQNHYLNSTFGTDASAYKRNTTK